MSKNPISILQELTQHRGWPLPNYSEGGQDEFNLFTCVVKIENIEAKGSGTTKKAAKQECAQSALQKLMISTNRESPAVTIESPQKNYVGLLNEFASKKGISYPIYTDLGLNLNGEFVTTCKFLNEEHQGCGVNKKICKQNAAKKVYERVKDKVVESEFVFQKSVDIINDTIENQKVIEIFKTLSLNEYSLTSSKQKEETQLKYDILNEFNMDEVTLEVLIEKIKCTGYKYEIKEFSSDPCIMVLQINKNNFTILGSGNNKYEATIDVLKNTLIVLKYGCSLLSECPFVA